MSDGGLASSLSDKKFPCFATTCCLDEGGTGKEDGKVEERKGKDDARGLR